MAVSQIDRTTGLASSAAIKAPCYLATTANITLAGEQTIDGVSATAGKRVLVKDQTVPAQNGIYIVATGDWERAPDFSSNDSVREGTRTWVTDGATYAQTELVVTTADPIDIGTTSITFATATSLLNVAAVGSAIHSATADTPTDADELGFWESVAGTLRKITWANFKTALGLALGAIIASIAAKAALVAADSIVINDSEAANASKQATLATLFARGSILQPPATPVNMSLAASVGSNALTISLKGADGNDPSAANPVLIPFRSVTDSSGVVADMMITAATSLVISAGSTLGTISGSKHRLWVIGINDGGTFRLGVVNCLSGTGVMALFPGLTSSTAEGGAGGADSAHTVYTGVAVTSKPFVVLGYVELTEATAGTWATAPSRIKAYQLGDPLPGSIVNSRHTETGAVATGTTVAPNDDTIPQITEGDQYMSQAITPLSGANVLEVNVQAVVTNSAGAYMTVALHRDAVANAVSAVQTGNSVGTVMPLSIKHREKADTVAATTFTVRAGGGVAGTTTFNGTGGARRMGAVMNSFINVTEIMA